MHLWYKNVPLKHKKSTVVRITIWQYILRQSRKKYEKAVKHYLKAIECDPTLADPHFNLGTYNWTVKNDIGSAEKSYRNATELNPTHAEMHYGLAAVLEEKKDFAGAEKEYLIALKLSPECKYSYWLACMLGPKLNRWVDAAKYMKAAASISHQTDAIHGMKHEDVAGWVAGLTGNTDGVGDEELELEMKRHGLHASGSDDAKRNMLRDWFLDLTTVPGLLPAKKALEEYEEKAKKAE